MRTTVDLPTTPLLRRARRFMKTRGVTLRESLERGLREVLDGEAPEVADRGSRSAAGVVRKATGRKRPFASSWRPDDG